MADAKEVVVGYVAGKVIDAAVDHGVKAAEKAAEVATKHYERLEHGPKLQPELHSSRDTKPAEPPSK